MQKLSFWTYNNCFLELLLAELGGTPLPPLNRKSFCPKFLSTIGGYPPQLNRKKIRQVVFCGFPLSKLWNSLLWILVFQHLVCKIWKCLFRTIFMQIVVSEFLANFTIFTNRQVLCCKLYTLMFQTTCLQICSCHFVCQL